MADQKVKDAPKLAGVVGWPINHSLSPLIHTIWAHRAKIDGYYIPIAAPPSYDDFVRTMDSLRVVGFRGVNITLPHKTHALRYAQDASAVAKKVGAANMLTFNDKGPYADNSDVAGFSSSVRHVVKNIQGIDSALVLGAGGASRAILSALRDLGVRNIAITNRTLEKAEQIAKEFNVNAESWADRNSALKNADIVVNTTSLGMTGQPPLELDVSAITKNMIVADIVYSPLETTLLKAAKLQGCVTVDGLDMLMHQAAPGFQAWFGGDSLVDDALRAELIRALDRRSGQ